LEITTVVMVGTLAFLTDAKEGEGAAAWHNRRELKLSCVHTK
jgi:hypothetical protein